MIHVYTGADAEFLLYDDDGSTEEYKTEKQFSLTLFQFRQANTRLTIGPTTGTYKSAPARDPTILFSWSFRIDWYGG